MGAVHEQLSDQMMAWIRRQPMFFVATAPLAGDGHVNVSPKGMADTFDVVDERTVAYLDLTGSGVETVAHIQENARITVMWCAFEGPARIVRVHGRGEVILPGMASWESWRRRFPAAEHRGARAVIVVHAQRISDSCGYSVPLMHFAGERTRLTQWTDSRSDDELAEYRRSHNATSIDGLPALH